MDFVVEIHNKRQVMKAKFKSTNTKAFWKGNYKSSWIWEELKLHNILDSLDKGNNKTILMAANHIFIEVNLEEKTHYWCGFTETSSWSL